MCVMNVTLIRHRLSVVTVIRILMSVSVFCPCLRSVVMCFIPLVKAITEKNDEYNDQDHRDSYQACNEGNIWLICIIIFVIIVIWKKTTNNKPRVII